jgi:hypothetical protein
MTELIEFFFDVVSPFGWWRALAQGLWPGGHRCSG